MDNKKILSSLNGIKGDIFFILFILFFQLLFIFQGLDFTDEGTYATLYQQIFDSPEALQYMFPYWLTLIIGGVWLKIFPALGLLGIRIAGVLITTLTVLIVYNALKKYVKINNLRLGLFLAIIICNYNLMSEFYYNKLSLFFWAISFLLILKGLKCSKLPFIFLSGIFIGINIFTRLPNVLGVFIVVSVFYYGWLTGKSSKEIIYQAITFIAGFLTGIILIVLIMSLIGHLEIYLNSVIMTMGISSDIEDPHNLVFMTNMMLFQLAKSISFAGFFFIISLMYSRVSQFYNSKRFYSNVDRVFLLASVLAIVFVSLTGRFSIEDLWVFVIGIIFVVDFYVLSSESYSPEYKLISCLGLIVLITFPFGSASGFAIPGRYAIIISFPIVIDVLRNFRKFNISFISDINETKEETFTNIRLHIIPGLFICTCLIAGLIFWLSSTYRDSSSRIKMVYPVENDRMKGIYTTKKRAKVVMELLTASSRYVKAGDYVFAYKDIPMFHYLTETKPYLSNPWPDIYTSNLLREAIDNSKKNVDGLPVVVLQKVNMRDNSWPENAHESYSLTSSNEPKNKYLQDFLNEFKYKTVWENDAFCIMKPDTILAKRKN